MDPRLEDGEQRTTPVEDLIEVQIDDKRPECRVKVGSGLTIEARGIMVEALKRNADVFAWTHDDMVGINHEVICHRLNVDPNRQPKRQRHRAMNTDRYMALKEEVDKLIKIWFIEEA